MPKKWFDWSKGMPRAQSDFLILLALALPLFIFVVWVDALDKFFEYSRVHEEYEIDEILSFLFFVGIAAIVYSARRIADLRREIDQRRAVEAEAQRLARHDILTGLPNRRRFLEEFNSQVLKAGKDQRCALFVIDLDYFKPINDLYGHRLGDEVLRVVAQRLTDIVEDRGTVTRLGGDEFGIVMTVGQDDELPLSLARRIVHDIPRPINLAALSLEVAASVGVSMFDPKHEGGGEVDRRERNPVETVLRQADMAMYRAKMAGRARYRFFDNDMDQRLQQRVQLEREIRGAVERGEIVPYYQPFVNLQTEETIGYELLARWRHPTMGVLPPSLFIPIAEDTGVIGALTDSLLARGLKEAKAWPEHICLAVNLSPRQFADPMLVQKILDPLAASGFSPERLEIEITETAVVQRLEEAKTTLEALRKLGVRIALDDFGTGYSGLHHLRELQLDTIKIDRSFVSEMLKHADDEKLVEAIVSMGRVLGLRTMAEGIETKEVLEKLVALGCETGQGFLFGRPEPMTARALKKAHATHPSA
jgi:diguanylate cyclase (GGDEF)-like protein